MNLRSWLEVGVLVALVLGVMSFFQWGNYDFISKSEARRLNNLETYAQGLEARSTVQEATIDSLVSVIDLTKLRNDTLKDLYDQKVSEDADQEELLKSKLRDVVHDPKKSDIQKETARTEYWKGRALRAENRIDLLESSHRSLEELVAQQDEAIKKSGELILTKNEVIKTRDYQIDVYKKAFERKGKKGMGLLGIIGLIGGVIGYAIGNL